MESNDLVSRVLRAHAAEALGSYRGNLAFAMHVVERGWLPEENDPAVQQQLHALHQHLVRIGHPDDDRFLLRLGLTVPGWQRGITPPIMVLDSNRGGFSDRRQREAAAQILRLREALTVGHRFVDMLNSDTRIAIAELCDWVQRQPEMNDEAWLGLIGELTADSTNQLANQAVDCIETSLEPLQEVGAHLVQRLACFRQSPLSAESCVRLIDLGLLWPSSIYRDSGDAAASQLLSAIGPSTDPRAVHLLLRALAWTRSPAARQAFWDWSVAPPAWASTLTLRLDAYPSEAGWCFDDDGEWRHLISLECHRLIVSDDTSNLPRVPCRRQVKKKCPSCDGQLAWLFDFSEIPDAYFAGEFAEAPRQVACCLHCACFQPVFTSYRDEFAPDWISPHEPSKFQNRGVPGPCTRILEATPRPPFACAESFGLEDASALGGMPMWLQTVDWPHCIECGRMMTFLAQHDNGVLGEEGVYYAFFCTQCRIAAVTYQQT